MRCERSRRRGALLSLSTALYVVVHVLSTRSRTATLGSEYWHATKKYMCEACNRWMPDKTRIIEEHNNSPEHQRQERLYKERMARYANVEKRNEEQQKRIERAQEENMKRREIDQYEEDLELGRFKPYEYDDDSGYHYHAYWRHYYDTKSGYYWGGEDEGWTKTPNLPKEGLYGGFEEKREKERVQKKRKMEKDIFKQLKQQEKKGIKEKPWELLNRPKGVSKEESASSRKKDYAEGTSSSMLSSLPADLQRPPELDGEEAMREWNRKVARHMNANWTRAQQDAWLKKHTTGTRRVDDIIEHALVQDEYTAMKQDKARASASKKSRL